jgi:hypothetical protein
MGFGDMKLKMAVEYAFKKYDKNNDKGLDASEVYAFLCDAMDYLHPGMRPPG